MADEKSGKGGGPGPFELGRCYEVDARLSSGPVRRQGPRDSRVRRVGPSRTWLAAAGVAVLAVGPGVWSLLGLHAPEPRRVDDIPGESPFFADGQDLALAAIAYPMPETPFKEQRKPPCLEGTETEIRGGCWIQHKLDAPCPRNTAEYQGKCFIPVKKPEPLPRSVMP